MPAVTPEPIMKVAMGFMASKHLFAASEIGLFEALSLGAASLQELSGRIGVPARTLGIVTAAMVSLGLIEQDGNLYRNSDAAAAFLAGNSGRDLRPMLRYFDKILWQNWEDLVEAVRTDQGQPRFGKFTREQQQIFSDGVEAVTTSAAMAVAASYDFGRHRSILDVAGGTGSFLVHVLRRNSSLKGTLFELPGACAIARQKLAELPEGARINIVEGDVFKDPFPGDHDVLIVANTIHIFSVAHNIELLRKMRAHVQPGTRLLLADLWTDPSHSQPAAAALISGSFLLTSGEGQAYSEEEADEWLGQTGWQKLERKALAGPHSLIVAEAI
jgi:ubiquinone/menaquinone biosynthesis C-methylase UbiE